PEKGDGSGVSFFERGLGVAGVVAVPFLSAENGGVAGVAEEHGAKVAVLAPHAENGHVVVAGTLELAFSPQGGDFLLGVLAPVHREGAFPAAGLEPGWGEGGDGEAGHGVDFAEE